MNSRTGKIARLPKAIREELNQRLEEGETAVALVDWLNALPEVQALVQGPFGGHPIREQNLSQWKNGGYQDWLRHQEALELAARLHEQAEEMKRAATMTMTMANGKWQRTTTMANGQEQTPTTGADGQVQGTMVMADGKGQMPGAAAGGQEQQMPMNEVLTLWLSARYALATREIAAAEGMEGWKLLRQMCGDVAKLRRIEQQERRLALEEKRVAAQCDAVAIERERWQEEKVVQEAAAQGLQPNGEVGPPPEPTNARSSRYWTDQEKAAWARHPDVWGQIRPLSPKERAARIRQIYGIERDWRDWKEPDETGGE